MLILAGLMTIIGSTEKAIGLVADIPFVSQASRAEWELKLMVLICCFYLCLLQVHLEPETVWFCDGNGGSGGAYRKHARELLETRQSRAAHCQNGIDGCL